MREDGDKSDAADLFDLIEKMLDYDPDKRISLTEALDHPYFDRLKPEEQLHRIVVAKSQSREARPARKSRVTVNHSASR